MEENRINGWNMLDSYKEGQAIYGRDEEIDSISESIQYNIQTFLYGKSGIGKTSLLQAGVFPMLRENHYFPVIIRLAFYERESLNSVVKKLVFEEAQSNMPEVGKSPLISHPIDDSKMSEMSLYEFFSKVCFKDESEELYIPVLVFDQFEETINNEENWQRTVDFLKDELYDLIDNSSVIAGESLPYTNYRIVISMREDYLYCLEDIVDQFALWELRYNRFRIKALDDAKAAEVIYKTSGAKGIEQGKEQQIVETIVKVVKMSSGTRFTEINTALLSLICSLLYENSVDKCIHYKELRNVNAYLRFYYDDICETIGTKATRYLENNLLTSDGRRSSVDEAEALNSKKIDQEDLDYLVNKKLLRKIKTDSHSNRYEYIHDLFAKMVYKRKEDDKLRWKHPELRSLSKKEDLISFATKFILSLFALSGLTALYMLFHTKTKHGTWNLLISFDPSRCLNTMVYFSTLVFSVYLLSLIVKRLHDVNRTGWLCLIIPLSILLYNSDHYIHLLLLYPSVSLLSIVVGLCKVLAVILFLCFLYQILRPGVNIKRTSGLSKQYEMIYNEVPINNLEFVKFFLLEIAWWSICCVMSDMIYYSNSQYEDWRFFYFTVPIVPLDWIFGLKLSLPAVIALLPLVISLSPSLKARVSSFGYSKWLTYIPYVNILFVIEGLLPNNMLMWLGLINTEDNNINRDESENVFAEISDDLIVIEDTNSLNHNLQMNGYIAWLLLLVPLYGIFYSFRKDQKIGIRNSSLGFALFNWIIMVVLMAFLASKGYLDNLNEFVGWFLLVLLVVGYFVPLVGLALTGRRIKKEITRVIINNPTYSINQIAAELALQPSVVEKMINKDKKRGRLVRVEENGQIEWKVIRGE